MSNPTPTTLREILSNLDENYSLWAKTDTTYMQHDLAEATQSIKQQLKALLPKKINAEMPNATTVAYNRCLSDVEKAIEEWAK